MVAQEDGKMVSKWVYKLYQSSRNMITAVPLAAQKMIFHVVSELIAQVFWQLELTKIQDVEHKNSLEHQIIPCHEQCEAIHGILETCRSFQASTFCVICNAPLRHELTV
jgi:hypothetical protein